MTPAAIERGARVRVSLPDKSLPWARSRWITGTVTDTDDRGVTVALDEMVNGVWDCHATRNELRPA